MPDVETAIFLPPSIAKQIDEQVYAGWFSDTNTLVIEALLRYLETHRDELMERFIREDIEWAPRR